ncbi:MAG: aminomethyl-transferring glycine dehydrogenase subunit GcvPB [Deltaproteobacteria bacterium]|nr:aminomethyl-transferring glycine dehydrogenase subunit GcvPB [Deltaproteobacteria bacterium]MCD6295595.1 aminomethyl-transferring glycine dehydrogenase subunit GcvPB [Deltaproteobacteria bacterium]
MKLIFEKSVKGRDGYSLPVDSFDEVDIKDCIPDYATIATRKTLSEVSEVDVVRHFTKLSKFNHGVDDGLYPLGSCTMKYNPKVNEKMAALDNFVYAHPLAPEETVQGCLEIMHDLNNLLCEITGVDQYTLSPAAGAHGELVGNLIMRKYFVDHNEKRHKMLVPDSAHGTNPASAGMAGFKIVEVKSNEKGAVDVEQLHELMDENTAGLMLTNPNTVGLYDEGIKDIERIVHGKGGLLYYDGANLNASFDIMRPGDVGFDIVHLNLHKTFSTPHGGGGPGGGAIGVKNTFTPYLPTPIVTFDGTKYHLTDVGDKSIGKIRTFWANFSVLVKTYAWILSMGADGLHNASEVSIINANYVLAKLKKYYKPSYDRYCGHECVLTGRDYKKYGIKTLDIAKRLMDYGFHPPTIYFPHFAPYAEETMMIEPPESESKEEIDEFIDAMVRISNEAKTNSALLKDAPHNTPIKRTNDVLAARRPILNYDDELKLRDELKYTNEDIDF